MSPFRATQVDEDELRAALTSLVSAFAPYDAVDDGDAGLSFDSWHVEDALESATRIFPGFMDSEPVISREDSGEYEFPDSMIDASGMTVSSLEDNVHIIGIARSLAVIGAKYASTKQLDYDDVSYLSDIYHAVKSSPDILREMQNMPALSGPVN